MRLHPGEHQVKRLEGSGARTSGGRPQPARASFPRRATAGLAERSPGNRRPEEAAREPACRHLGARGRQRSRDGEHQPPPAPRRDRCAHRGRPRRTPGGRRDRRRARAWSVGAGADLLDLLDRTGARCPEAPPGRSSPHLGLRNAADRGGAPPPPQPALSTNRSQPLGRGPPASSFRARPGIEAPPARPHRAAGDPPSRQRLLRGPPPRRAAGPAPPAWRWPSSVRSPASS